MYTERPVERLRSIELLEQFVGTNAIMETLPLQAGNVPHAEVDASALFENIEYPAGDGNAG